MRLKTRKTVKAPVSPAEEFVIMAVNSLVKEAIAKMPASEQGITASVEYHSLWIGLLIGSGTCDTFDNAYSWATWVRYEGDGKYIGS